MAFEDNKPNEVAGLINFIKRESVARHLSFIQDSQDLILSSGNIFDDIEDIHLFILYHLPFLSENFFDTSVDKILHGVSFSNNELKFKETGFFILFRFIFYIFDFFQMNLRVKFPN